MRRGLIALTALLCTLAAGSLPASAGAAGPSKLTIGVGFKPERGNPFFQGKIKDGPVRCRTGRRVVVFRVRNFGRRTRIGSTGFGPRGHWTLDMADRMRTAAYYAVARGKPGCPVLRSRDMPVGQNGVGGNGPGAPN